VSSLAATILLCTLAQPGDEGMGAAKREFDRGMHYYNLGEFELALDHFKAAYEAAPHVELLFDIGQCHRNLGENERAIFFFERYVQQVPSGDDAEEVRSLLVELRDPGPIVYDPPPLTSTVSESVYDLSIPAMPSYEKPPLVQRWWFWAALFGAAAVAAGSVVLIAALTDPAGRDQPLPGFDPDL
jgi:tetratricopeptide (TPR) repeat protein